MAASLAPFAAVESRLNASVLRRLANATATWQGGQPFGVIFDRSQLEGFMGDAVTGVSRAVSLCVANAPGITEGSTALVLSGQPCEVTGPVVADASGWAVFPIVFLN